MRRYGALILYTLVVNVVKLVTEPKIARKFKSGTICRRVCQCLTWFVIDVALVMVVVVVETATVVIWVAEGQKVDIDLAHALALDPPRPATNVVAALDLTLARHRLVNPDRLSVVVMPRLLDLDPLHVAAPKKDDLSMIKTTASAPEDLVARAPWTICDLVATLV